MHHVWMLCSLWRFCIWDVTFRGSSCCLCKRRTVFCWDRQVESLPQIFEMLQDKSSLLDCRCVYKNESSVYLVWPTHWRRPNFDPLTTDDAFWHSLTFATCYQLVQSVLKIGFVLFWLAVERPWLTLARPFLTLLAQMSAELPPLPL